MKYRKQKLHRRAMGTFQQYYDEGGANLQRHEEFKGFTARKSIKFSLQLPTREAGED